MHKAHAKSAEAKRQLPDKLFYKIGEVSRLADVEPYVLRYWESEFAFLKPRKSRSGQRVYVKKDLETILKIKGLLYDERYTIEGVRKRLGEGIRPEPQAALFQPPAQAFPEATAGPEGPPPAARPGAFEARLSSPASALEHVKQRLRNLLNTLT